MIITPSPNLHQKEERRSDAVTVGGKAYCSKFVGRYTGLALRVISRKLRRSEAKEIRSTAGFDLTLSGNLCDMITVPTNPFGEVNTIIGNGHLPLSLGSGR